MLLVTMSRESIPECFDSETESAVQVKHYQSAFKRERVILKIHLFPSN